MSEQVLISVKDHIAEVLINRPEKKNALSWEVFEGLTAAGERLKREASVRAVVLAGVGGNFSSGIDLTSLQSGLSSNSAFRGLALPEKPGDIANRFQKAAHVWRELAVPVIAAVEGVCFGGGIQIALGADIRIAAPDARLSVMEVKWGLIPDMALMTSLPRLMRLDQAKELVWTGRIVEADEAAQLGLVTRIAADPMADARKLAADIASRSPDAVRGGKRLLDEGWPLDAKDALALEARLQCEILGLENQQEAVRANMERRPPVFRDV